MATRDDKLANSAIIRGELIRPASTIGIRALTDHEIDRLQKALGKPVDRNHLNFWLSKSIENVVKFSAPPTARECRDRFFQIVREGREWLEHIDNCPGGLLLGQTAELRDLRAIVSGFCDRLEATARSLKLITRQGHPRTPLALYGFLENMLGIAKRAKVMPSTPSRAQRKPGANRFAPDFFIFVIEAIEIAKRVIKSSPLRENQKADALSILRVHSKEALSKTLEGLRGRIGDYRASAHGLVEWIDSY